MHSFVITGFLGVGKTTMLTNSVKEYFPDKKIAIIVNEFGDIGIDGNILKNVHSEVLEISEGCICCQLSQEFESGVIEIMQKYDPEIIFVETSGASEPFPIFLSLQNLGIAVEGVICVIDSKNFDSYKENSTAKYQIGGSNILVLNKTDLVNDEELSALKEDVRTIKEQYNIKNNLTGESIFNGFTFSEATQGIVKKELFDGVYELEEIVDIAKEYTEDTQHISKDLIAQKVVYLKEGIAFAQIDELLKVLPKNIYRAKGIVKTDDVANPLLINYSFGNVSFDELDEYTEQPVLIFIGENIEEDVKELAKNFDFLIIPQFRLTK